ncbi:putative FAD dependent oxidoreductase domain-containing protein [Seiridium cardinale]|uniref:FAD dependent oxidoreductase domain-containing protein n=1 Tax=Seiridium cardinale TaxID=138064 RepID=A0ABR2XPD4_9PEZI
MTTRKPASKDEHVLIVGAGVFGLSTALELKKRGYHHVTALDRYLPPVLDGSSVDISRVIRTDYADPLYGKMAIEAYEGWVGGYRDYYHHSGFVILANQQGNSYIEKSKEVSEALGSKLEEFEDGNEVRRIYPNIPANLGGLKAYHNPQGGWADAAASTVLSLKYTGKRVVGVNVVQGEPILAAQIVLATGAWSNTLIPITGAMSASGQPVGFIQLTRKEAEELKDIPVIINLNPGVFCFPPTPQSNILKIARHGYGWATQMEGGKDEPGTSQTKIVSAPKRDGNNVDASYLPDDAEEALREGLRQLLPQFANHSWMNRRLCWYSDTPQGDFIIDHHPKIEGLFLATGGAGHAFKFLPVLGHCILECYENNASLEVRNKWRLTVGDGLDGITMAGDGSRGGPPLRVLDRKGQAKL